MRNLFGNIGSSILKAYTSVSDLFTRTTSNSLGVSTSGAAWKTVNGTWVANGSGAVTNSDASTYPISTVTMKKVNSTIVLGQPGSGAGAALWVSSAGSWWGASVQQAVCSGCGSCANYNPYVAGNTNQAYTNPVYTNPGHTTPGTLNAGYTNPGSTNPASGGTCSTYAPYSATNCSNRGVNCGQCTGYNPVVPGNSVPGNYVPGYYNPPVFTPGNSSGGNPVPSYTNPSSGGTCASYYDTYPRKLVLLQNASNAVSTIASQALDSLTSFPAIAALKVAITGGTAGSSSSATITASAYSDSAMTTQIGSNLVYNATGVNVIANYGIIATPSSYNQSEVITAINIQ